MGPFSEKKRFNFKSTPIRSLPRLRPMAVIRTPLSKLPKKVPEGVEGPNLKVNRDFDQVIMYAMEQAFSYLTTPTEQCKGHTRKFTATLATVERDWGLLGELINNFTTFNL